MLKLFQSIFGNVGKEHGYIPESIIQEAIERAVDGTDPRVRVVSGYRKRLREPIIHAIEHVVALVARVPAPLFAGRGNYQDDPRFAALFASADHMLETFGHDPRITAFLEGLDGRVERIAALLLADHTEKNVLGMELEGEMLRRDVAQVAVSFDNHRLLDPTASEEATRRQLRRRAFDYLLTAALARIAEVSGERANLALERDILRRKMSALQRGGGSFERQEAGASADPAKLAAELEEIEGQLAALGTDANLLHAHLDIVVDVLSQCDKQVWVEDTVMTLDRMNIKHDARDTSARSIALQELNNPRGHRVAVLFVSLDPSELPRREDLFAAAQRYL
jgi:hypothetical protein